MLDLRLNLTQRKPLEALLARRSAHAGHVRRTRIVLRSADGISGREIAERVGISEQHVSRIRARFVAGGVPGLEEQPKAGRKDHVVSADTTERIIQTTLSPPPAGRTRWTTRLLAKEFNLTSATVSKISARSRTQAALRANVQSQPGSGLRGQVEGPLLGK